MNRKLNLSKETLRALTGTEAVGVAVGNEITNPHTNARCTQGRTCATTLAPACYTNACTLDCPTGYLGCDNTAL